MPCGRTVHLIAVLTLPIIALSSVYGMNIIVNDRTDFPHLAVVVAAMMAISAVFTLAYPVSNPTGSDGVPRRRPVAFSSDQLIR